MDANQIKSLRLALKMSQLEFARACGLQTKGAVSKLEHGESRPSGPLLMQLRRLAETAPAAK
jgi:transcriptional regulator with XRE-family HTH domain